MIRKSGVNDIAEVANIYGKLLDSDSTRAMTGWEKGVYPSHQTALDAHNNGELFVMEVEGEIVAAAIINQKQLDAYSDGDWEFGAPDDEIMVLHTLVVDPERSGKGYATEFVSFYEDYALENKCRYLRMDTNEANTAARKLYKRLGYRESGIVSCVFNGIQGVRLVCLEKKH